MPFEDLRRSYLPSKVKVLFIGESPPANGTFFYLGDSNLAQYTKNAFEAAFGACSDVQSFLKEFKNKGFYLEDLCPFPVNNLDGAQRNLERRNGRGGLAANIQVLSPRTVVIVMKSIERDVLHALKEIDGGQIQIYALPFPAMGHQAEYVNQLKALFREMNRKELL